MAQSDTADDNILISENTSWRKELEEPEIPARPVTPVGEPVGLDSLPRISIRWHPRKNKWKIPKGESSKTTSIPPSGSSSNQTSVHLSLETIFDRFGYCYRRISPSLKSYRSGDWLDWDRYQFMNWVKDNVDVSQDVFPQTMILMKSRANGRTLMKIINYKMMKRRNDDFSGKEDVSKPPVQGISEQYYDTIVAAFWNMVLDPIKQGQ